MIVEGIKLTGVRNLASCVLEPGPHFNVLFGNNGQGKTNLIETIYVVGTLRSFRTQRLADLIGFDTEEAYVGARVRRGGLERKYELTIGARARKVRLDGKAVRPIAKYFGDFNVVLFAPEDLLVPRGSPAERRRFLDRAVFNWQASHLTDTQAYEKVLRNRNALLKEMLERGSRSGRDELLAVYDEQLADIGARLVAARRSYIDDIRPRFQRAFREIVQLPWQVDAHYRGPDEVVAVAPEPGPIAAALRGLLRDTRARDFARGATNVGPHRDDLEFTLDERAAAAFASQGQLRALVLAWKTAELDQLEATHGDPPVLLLDDVSSELDATRNAYLFEFLRGRANQCFITTTDAKHVLLDRGRTDFEVANGLISQAS